ncbi:MAG: bifunctional adenosylcobinamide kinase/adenosylcobinamide-phosphate guanylyltransferase [Oscillospiraceae bacterium]|nr:bifunctional adenosylcobinamide kinase/adenosylcobinamide-phosphate guanylyltransferase [Oscillospiraceae bacterium]
MIVFICGGSKSGKSSLAQNISKALSKDNALYYVATMIPSDAEDKEKICLHIEDRADMGFDTVECGTDIVTVLNTTDKNGTFMLDSVTALLTNEMYGDFGNIGVDIKAAERCIKDIRQLAETVNNIIIVSDYIFSDAENYDESTKLFCKSLADIGNDIATYADVVIEMNIGNATVHKGKDIYETIL